MKSPQTSLLKFVGFGAGALLVLGLVLLFVSPKFEFLVGGALLNAGYRLQDPLKEFDLESAEHVDPEELWDEVQSRNSLASTVRDSFPRTSYHPLVAMVTCMDNRIDAHELVGDTRNYYYIVRTAGSVMPEPEQEMLELAVQNGVKLVLLTSHTKCAAEGAAADTKLHAQFPSMTTLVDEREESIREFLARPLIREKIEAGELKVQRARIDTANERLIPHALDTLPSTVNMPDHTSIDVSHAGH